jgi:hypothetical protein
MKSSLFGRITKIIKNALKRWNNGKAVASLTVWGSHHKCELISFGK